MASRHSRQPARLHPSARKSAPSERRVKVKIPLGGGLMALHEVHNTLGPKKTRARYTVFVNALWSLSMSEQLITVDPEIHSGTPVFAGTRVPVKTLFDHLKAVETLEVFLDDFPSVSRELAIAVLEKARVALVPDAHLA